MALRIDPNNIPSARATAPRVDANDFKQFAALRRGAAADDPATLRAVARQFESLFTKMMLESMRSASIGDPMFGSDQGDMYQDMADDQLAVQLSQGKGLGLADMLDPPVEQRRAAERRRASAPDAATTASRRPKNANNSSPSSCRMREAAARELGVDPRNLIAQAALETGWGRSQPGGDSHNLFGIKAGRSWNGASVQANTQEFAGGVASASTRASAPTVRRARASRIMSA